MATGSSNKVREAYSSGTPAYVVGVGNAVIVVDETADLEETALKIRIGKTKDNASGCSAENSLVVHESIYDDFIKKLQAQGGYLTNAEEKQKVKNALWINGKINGDIVAKPVDHIAKIAGIELPPSSAFIMVEETDGSSESLFSHEKLSLVLTIYKYSDFDEAVQMVNTIHSHCGSGHSCGIHSNNQEHILKLALNTKTVKVLVRQPHGISNGGAWHNGLAPTFSNSCGTWGGNIASENITQKHFINTTWLSFPLDRKPGSDQEIYQDLLDNVKLL
jgi:sulfoacetaldehyde dehydrogenase